MRSRRAGVADEVSDLARSAKRNGADADGLVGLARQQRNDIINSSMPSRNGGVGGGLPYKIQNSAVNMTGQELPMSCGPACGRQILEDTGTNISEEMLREAAFFDSRFGTDAGDLARGMNQLSLNAQFRGGGVSPEAFDALNNTGSWIARVKPSTGPHFVIVDGVENDIVHLRDPWGGASPGIDTIGTEGIPV